MMELNIMRVAFRGKTRIDVKPLYQYDYGQKIKFIDLTLPTNYEVHFSNYEHGEAITMIGDSSGVEIPDELLQTGLDVYVWIYLHEGNDDGATEYSCIIPIYKRAKITNQEPIPVQQDTITQTLAAMNTTLQTTQAAASSATQAATDAEAYRTTARGYMEITQGYMEEAKAYGIIQATAESLPAGSDATAAFNNGVMNFGIPRSLPELPTLPSEIGTYILQTIVDENGIATISWQLQEEHQNG